MRDVGRSITTKEIMALFAYLPEIQQRMIAEMYEPDTTHQQWKTIAKQVWKMQQTDHAEGRFAFSRAIRRTAGKIVVSTTSRAFTRRGDRMDSSGASEQLSLNLPDNQ